MVSVPFVLCCEKKHKKKRLSQQSMRLFDMITQLFASPMKQHAICVVGSGYVGLVTGGCLSELGHHVVCVDSDKAKVRMLKAGKCPIYEPGLPELLRRNMKAGRLSFTDSIRKGMHHGGRRAQVVFIAVGTPPRPDGSADLSAVEAAAAEIARAMTDYTVIVDKSTVPVETGEWVQKTVARINKRGVPFDVASNPEFLAEGTAVADFLKPDRVVLGVASPRAKSLLREVYEPVKGPVLVTDVKSAELIKHASNSFLATKISFVNAVSRLCEAVGADIGQVTQGMGLDKRIGPSFLRAGLGFGGFCLHPEERVLLRDPQGTLRSMTLREAHGLVRTGERPWEALSLDPRTGAQRFQPVTALSRRPYDGVLVTVRTKMGRSVRVTADHPMLLRGGAGWTTRTAAELTEDDWLPAFLTVPASPAALRVDMISALQAHRPPYFDRILVRPRATGFWRMDAAARLALGELLRGRPSRIHDIARRGAPLRLPEYLRLEHLLKPGRDGVELATAKGRATWLPNRIELTPAFCRFLGYYASEGCLTRERSERGLRERMTLHFHERETEYRRDALEVLRGLGVRTLETHVRQHHTRRITASSRLLAFLLDEVLRAGRTSYDARVPDEVLTSPSAQRAAFVTGAWRGDGSAYFATHSPSVTLEFGTASPGMAEGMTTLLHSLGIVPSRKSALQNKSTVPAHFLRVSGADQVRFLADAKDSQTRRRIESRLGRLKREPAPAGFRRLGGQTALVRVTGLNHRRYRGPVYCLEVAGTPNFALPSGLLVHNCFPKDLEAFYWIAKKKGYDFKLLQSVQEINETQKDWVLRKIEELLWNLEGKRVAVLGLSFKPNTDDLRFAPSLDIIRQLRERGVKVVAHDPVAMAKAKKLLPPGVELARDPYAAAKGADALVLVTEWAEYKSLDFKRIRALMLNPIVLDGRNLYDPEKLRALGFSYRSVGRP